MLTTVEKVIFLQDFDIFANTMTEDLAHLAGITSEVKVKQGHIIYNEGDYSDALYMVIDGKVRLTREDTEVMVAGNKDFFGTWALFDDEPRVATATTLEESNLLKINKEDFFEVLADNVNITKSILKTLSKKMRSLVDHVRR